MTHSFKNIFIFIIVINIIALLWFLLGSTANFQRGIDLITAVQFMLMWLPLLILVLLAIVFLAKGRSENVSNVLFTLLIIAFFLIAIPLFKSVDTVGWLSDYVRNDPIKITSDGMYEYQLELINVYQNNNRERLYVKDVSNGEEMYIPLNIFTEAISAIYYRPDKDDWTWSLMTPTDELDIYELSTDDSVPGPKKTFLIDLKTGSAKLLE